MFVRWSRIKKKSPPLVAIPFIHLKNVFSKLKGIDPININRGSRERKTRCLAERDPRSY